MKNSLEQLAPMVETLKKYLSIIVIVAVGGIYAFLVVTAGSMVENDPSQAEISDAYKKAKRPKIDDIVVKKITELQDQNVQFQALIDEARDNPFVEE